LMNGFVCVLFFFVKIFSRASLMFDIALRLQELSKSKWPVV
jgi:hypothetical protein